MLDFVLGRWYGHSADFVDDAEHEKILDECEDISSTVIAAVVLVHMSKILLLSDVVPAVLNNLEEEKDDYGETDKTWRQV